MSNIESEASRMGVLVDDLLLLARLDQGRPLDREPVDLAVVASEAVESARAIDPDRTIELVADDPVPIVGDASRLRAATGWAPSIPLEQTLADLVASIQAGG
jgi:two-component system OmpR family sensor kinase